MSDSKAVQILNPTEYPGWDSLLENNKYLSFFASSAWAKVLQESYQYKPIYFVSFDKDQLVFLMPMMEVCSPLTGKRGVSLPFTDQCTPHALKREFLREATQNVIDYGEKAGWRYVEWRDGSYFPDEMPPSEVSYTHVLNLLPSEPDLFSSLRDSNRRNINKAISKGVSIKIGVSLELLDNFYRLICMTRKRHGLPPQPFSFFMNVYEDIFSQRKGIIVSALYSGKVVAASVFFHFGTNALFKYGASDIKYQDLRPNNLVMWEAIKWYKNQGIETLDLGRTESINHGLLRYKRAWGGAESSLKYYRYDIRKKSFVERRPKGNMLQSRLFVRLPLSILRLTGRILYKHFG
jgi:hypothetical protein